MGPLSDRLGVSWGVARLLLDLGFSPTPQRVLWVNVCRSDQWRVVRCACLLNHWGAPHERPSRAWVACASSRGLGSRTVDHTSRVLWLPFSCPTLSEVWELAVMSVRIGALLRYLVAGSLDSPVMARLFGTDGVRGRANVDLTAELAVDLSVAAAHILGEVGAFSARRPVALVGRDPRASGEFLQAAVVAGLASAGVDVVRLGVVPTPAVAYLVNSQNAELGVMISASHNPMPDNGIKFFSKGGVKLDDDIEDAIEQRMEEKWERPTGAAVGRVSFDGGAVEEYVAHLVSSLGARSSLDGLKVVIDCANGAAFQTAPAAFSAQGAEVIAINATPDGLNINENAGSTHMDTLKQVVVEHGADLGIALDGDADRCLAVDHEGNLIDGDQIMAILAISMKEQHKLHSDTLVATVMSNLGLFNAMRQHGISVDKTKVGDRYVLESMNANGFALGGEQSGHVIISEFANTGDGVLTGLHLAARMVETGKSLKELASVMRIMPQVMVNVRGVDKLRAGIDTEVQAAVSKAAQELGDNGRVLLRPSGTEPVVRVMVEASSEDQAQEIADRLAALVKYRLSL